MKKFGELLVTFLYILSFLDAAHSHEPIDKPQQLLLLSETGSGARLFLQSLEKRTANLSWYVVWEPCAAARRSFQMRWATSGANQSTRVMPFTSRDCGALLERVLTCNMHDQDHPLLRRVGSARIGLPNTIVEHRNACVKSNLRVVKESRFLPPAFIMRTATLVLHFIRDPRDLVLARILKSTIANKKKDDTANQVSTRAVAKSICTAQRLSLQTLAVLGREGRGRRFWLDRKYLAVKAEDVLKEPLILIDQTLAWAKGRWTRHDQTIHAAFTALKHRIDNDLMQLIEAQHRAHTANNWKQHLDFSNLVATMRECAAVVNGLQYPTYRWQTVDASSIHVKIDQNRKDPIQSMQFKLTRRLKWSKHYPRTAIEHSTDVCGHLWRPIHGLGGGGGTSASCNEELVTSLATCAQRLRAEPRCHAFTYFAASASSPGAPGGLCILHDRKISSFQVQPQRGAVHVPKSTTGLDACDTIDEMRPSPHEDDFSSPSQAFLGHLAVGHFGNTTRTLDIKDNQRESKSTEQYMERWVFIETELSRYPGFNYRELAECYRNESQLKVYPWEDEKKPDLAQNMAHVFAYEAILRSPLRTLDISKASIVVLPFDTVISGKLLRPCLGKSHEERMRSLVVDVRTWLEDHHESRTSLSNDAREEGGAMDRRIGQLYVGKQILVMGTNWQTFREWGGRAEKQRKVLHDRHLGTSADLSSGSLDFLIWPLLAPHAILVTIDEYFSHDWNKVLVAPYLAHSDISRRLLECRHLSSLVASQGPRKNGRASSNDGKTIQLYFRGGVDHGSMCKRTVSQYSETGRSGRLTTSTSWLRKAATEYFDAWNVTGVKFIATGNRKLVYVISSAGDKAPQVPETKSHSTYARADYVEDIMNTRFCIHLRGDTTTSRRLFDAIAALCIPVIISDDINLPFASQIAWNQFTITIPEEEIFRGKSATLEAIMLDMIPPERVSAMQYYLAIARHDLLWSAWSPFLKLRARNESCWGDANFISRTVDHLLQQAQEIGQLHRHAKYRRFRPAFEKCMPG